jgi:spore coat polysaccharide biosynthesis protein SpsF (cytidylyltransferase family)
MFNHRPGLGLEIADGFGAEIFRMSALESVTKRFTDSRYREHLTSPFWEHQDVFRVAALDTHPELKSLERRFDVDTREDLAFLENLIGIGGITFDTPAVEILETSRHV